LVQQLAPKPVIAALSKMHAALGGDAEKLATKTASGSPTPDLVHQELGCIIEVDEVQHFTSARLRSFDFYRADVRLGFDVRAYIDLCVIWRGVGDKAYAHKVSRDFPHRGGRQAQRAYNDALRDLLAPTFTGYPVIRIPVPDRSLRDAIETLRTALKSLQ
jgi:hypothetical protein